MLVTTNGNAVGNRPRQREGEKDRKREGKGVKENKFPRLNLNRTEHVHTWNT